MACSAISPKLPLVFVSGFLTVLLTGCALSGGTVASSGLTGHNVANITMAGRVHGGKQAIYNATVTLYAMNTGTANYGDTPTKFAQTTTGYDGSFAFTRGADGGTGSGSTYSCPSGSSTAAPGSANNPEMYLVASGGDTSGSINAGNAGSAYNNTAVKFVLAIGDCNSLSSSTQVIMNEMTTAGTVVALQQFFNPATEAIGAPSTNVTGLVNAVNLIPILVDTTKGTAQQSVTPTSTVAGITVTATPEYQKLNTIANILAACVSSTSSSSTACSALFASAVAPSTSASTNFSSISSYPTAADTALALDYMFINPTESQDYAAGSSKLFNLYNLPTTSTAPYAPALTSQPEDWTIGINYVPTGGCNNIMVKVNSITQPVEILESEYSVIVDKNGNVWMGGSGGSSTTGYDVLAEFNPQGGAINCLTSVSGTTANTAGRRMAIDSRGNIWWATSQGLIEYVTDAGNSAVGTILVWPQPSGIKASGMAADQNGNIYVSPDATAGFIYQYPGVATASTPFAATSIVALGDTSMNSAAAPYRDITITTAGNMVTEGTGTSANVYAYTLSGGNYTDVKVVGTGGISTPYGLAEASDGTSVGGNTCCARAGGVYRIDPSSGTMTSYSPNFAGGQNADRMIAIDGADNIWTSPGPYTNDTTGLLTAVGETDKDYNAISPQGNPPSLPCTSPCTAYGGFIKVFLPVASSYGMAIDGSGNVWGTPDVGTTLNGDPSTNVYGSYWVIVGQAVPVKTPIVANIH